MRDLDWPENYAVFENGAITSDMKFDNLVEIPNVKFFIKLELKKTETPPHYSNAHFFIDCHIMTREQEIIAVDFNGFKITHMEIFYNSSSWPQMHSDIFAMVVDKENYVYKIISFSSIARSNPIQNLNVIIKFLIALPKNKRIDLKEIEKLENVKVRGNQITLP